MSWSGALREQYFSEWLGKGSPGCQCAGKPVPWRAEVLSECRLQPVNTHFIPPFLYQVPTPSTVPAVPVQKPSTPSKRRGGQVAARLEKKDPHDSTACRTVAT